MLLDMHGADLYIHGHCPCTTIWFQVYKLYNITYLAWFIMKLVSSQEVPWGTSCVKVTRHQRFSTFMWKSYTLTHAVKDKNHSEAITAIEYRRISVNNWIILTSKLLVLFNDRDINGDLYDTHIQCIFRIRSLACSFWIFWLTWLCYPLDISPLQCLSLNVSLL